MEVSINNNVVSLAVTYAQKDKCTAIPGGRWAPSRRRWEYLLTPATASSILQQFDKQLSDTEKDALRPYAERLMMAHAVKNECADLIVPKTNTDPWRHQLVAYNMAEQLFGLRHPSGIKEQNIQGGGALLALDMGCGKSKVTVDLICNHHDIIKKVLIVCPHSVIPVWTGTDTRPGQFTIHGNPEAVKNLHIEGLGERMSVERKTRAAVTALHHAQRTNKTLVIVINYESVWRGDFGKWVSGQDWDLIACDEIHRIKSVSGQASKFFAKMASKSLCRLGLTGTPLPHALPTDAPILTPTGWKTMEQLSIGDDVIGRNGQPTKIIGVWPQGVQPVYTVSFSDGTSVECTEDHLWQVKSRGRRSRNLPPLIIKTGELNKPRPLPNSNGKPRENGYESLFDKFGAPRWHIPIMDPVKFDKQTIPLDPYFLGVLLGDGHIGNGIEFTSADQGVVDAVSKVLPDGLQLTKGHTNGQASQYRITSGTKGGSLKGSRRGPKPNQLKTILNSLGLVGSHSHDKFIPQCYLWNDIDTRLAVLRGLCDTDGSAYGSTTKFMTTSQSLMDDVVFLVYSLGGFGQLSKETPKLTTLPNGNQVMAREKYNFFFRLPFVPFLLERKIAKHKAQTRKPRKGIVAITPSRVCETQCITVDAEDGLYVTKDFIVTHNSPLDAYGQYRFMDPGIFGVSFTRFRAEYAIMGGFDGHQVLNYKNLDQMHDKMYLIAYRVMSDEVFDLPEFMDSYREFDLTADERRVYDEMDKEFCTQVQANLITADNALVKLLRLQQITSGHLDGIDVGDSKRKVLADTLEDLDVKEPVVIFARFTRDLEIVQEVCREQKRSYAELSGSKKELDLWQSGGADVLGVQIQSGKEGVDFTRARYNIYFSLGFSLGDYNQSRKRSKRPGQKQNGFYIHLVARNSIDAKVIKALENKEAVVESVLSQYLN